MILLWFSLMSLNILSSFISFIEYTLWLLVDNCHDRVQVLPYSILQFKPIKIFQDDIALVICMIILMAVTAGVVMFKVNKCFINFNLKVHIRVGVICDLSNIYVNSIFSISTWSMFVLHSNYLKSPQFLVHSDSTPLRNEICRSRRAIIL